jgi:hypothetical protein
MKAYSLDLRQRVLEAALSGEQTLAEVVKVFDVGTTFVNKMLRPHLYGRRLSTSSARRRAESPLVSRSS